ncbi:Histone-lysine N-methyltransferase SETMAR [Anthophora quadrimaculata]
MEVNKEKIRYILQFFFDKGENASQATEIVNGVYGPDTVTINYVQFWFRRFRSGIFDIKDAPRTGRPVVENVDKITEIIEVDRHQSWIPKEARCLGATPINTKKHDESNFHLRSIGQRNEIDLFLKRMVTGDEKWVTYDNIVRKRSWSKRNEAAETVAKQGLTSRKVLLCIWWDWKGIIYYELLPYGQTLNSDIYCQQLDRLKLAIDQKRPELANRRGVVFHQDNARPHTSIVTRQKLRELGWEVLMHPPYSPDLAPSDYHLFRALQNFLSDKKLASREDCENRLLQFFANKDQDFYERGIMKLRLKWQQIIEQNGAYLTQIGQSEIC